jgi:hypothetical protein
MKQHFTTQDWVDFVRNIGDPVLAVAIREHLAQACAECTENMQVWRGVMEQAKQLNLAEPPASSVSAVRASFRLRNVIPFPSGKLDLAVLQFDSSRQAVAVGIRSGHNSARQLLYKSGSVCIDMRMQPTPGSESIVLIGQLLDSMNPGHGIGGIPVSLLSQGDTLSRQQTNADGEFNFGLESSPEMQLVFGISDNRTIIVAVPQGPSLVM